MARSRSIGSLAPLAVATVLIGLGSQLPFARGWSRLPLAWSQAAAPDEVSRIQPPAQQPANDSTERLEAETAPPDPVTRPHWTATGCVHCHDPAEGPPKAIPHHRVDGICLQCHDGQRARAERHPVGRLFEGAPNIRQPPDWPAPDGRLSCVTCHDILIGCHPDPRRPAANPDFLRGWPAESLSAWCATCHTDLFDHGRHNPHIMLTDEGQLIERACRFCHYSPRTAGLKPAELERRIGEADLVRDDITLCLSCHATHREWFEPGHIGTRMTADIKKRLLEFESRLAAGGETDIRPTDDEVRPWLLPLAEGDIIVCATCHNPHQDGVFPPGSALSAGAIAFPRREDELPLRGLGKDLCSACHDR